MPAAWECAHSETMAFGLFATPLAPLRPKPQLPSALLLDGGTLLDSANALLAAATAGADQIAAVVATAGADGAQEHRPGWPVWQAPVGRLMYIRRVHTDSPDSKRLRRLERHAEAERLEFHEA